MIYVDRTSSGYHIHLGEDEAAQFLEAVSTLVDFALYPEDEWCAVVYEVLAALKGALA